MSCCHSRAPPFTIRLLVTVARLLWSPSTSFILWSAHHFLPTSSRPPHPHRPRLLARRRRSPRHLSRPCPNHRHRLFSRLAPRSPALLHLRPRTHGHQCPAVGEAVATAQLPRALAPNSPSLSHAVRPQRRISLGSSPPRNPLLRTTNHQGWPGPSGSLPSCS